MLHWHFYFSSSRKQVAQPHNSSRDHDRKQALIYLQAYTHILYMIVAIENS